MSNAPVRRRLRQAGAARAGGFQGLQFFRDTIGELRRVVWPSREQTTRLTILVVIISVFVGFLLGFIDMAFGQLFRVLV